MGKIFSGLVIIILMSFILNCSTPKHIDFKPKEVYQSKDLIIKQISPNAFEHISYLKTNDFGNLPSNGVVVRDGNYLGDANVYAWSATVEKVRAAYPNVKTVVPGHGNYGDTKLLDYTIKFVS